MKEAPYENGEKQTDDRHMTTSKGTELGSAADNGKHRSLRRWLPVLVALLVAAWLVGKRLLPPRAETPPADTEQAEQTEPPSTPSHSQQSIVSPPEAPGEDTAMAGAGATDADAASQPPASPETPQTP